MLVSRAQHWHHHSPLSPPPYSQQLQEGEAQEGAIGEGCQGVLSQVSASTHTSVPEIAPTECSTLPLAWLSLRRFPQGSPVNQHTPGCSEPSNGDSGKRDDQGCPPAPRGEQRLHVGVRRGTQTHRTAAEEASASPGGRFCREQSLRSSLGG